jgi:hypothetical protein
MYPEIPNDNARENELCRTSFKQHWAVAQIDGPMQTIARYDDVAKLLITIGGFLLAVLAGGYSAMVKDLRPYIDLALAKRISMIVLLSMLCFFICAACVCLPQPARMAGKILALKAGEDLDKDIEDWCKDIRGSLINTSSCYAKAWRTDEAKN